MGEGGEGICYVGFASVTICVRLFYMTVLISILIPNMNTFPGLFYVYIISYMFRYYHWSRNCITFPIFHNQWPRVSIQAGYLNTFSFPVATPLFRINLAGTV